MQNLDQAVVSQSDCRVVSELQPDEAQWADLLFAWKVSQIYQVNAIVYCRNRQTIGVGAGQMSRVYSSKVAILKAADEGLEIAGSVMASDAFFPFRDTIDQAAETGVSAIIQPGGSFVMKKGLPPPMNTKLPWYSPTSVTSDTKEWELNNLYNYGAVFLFAFERGNSYIAGYVTVAATKKANKKTSQNVQVIYFPFLSLHYEYSGYRQWRS